MDTIEGDIPAGVWSTQNERGTNITQRNLKWIGLVAYAVHGSPAFGCVYFGTGEPNHDLPFMLWSTNHFIHLTNTYFYNKQQLLQKHSR